MMNELFIYDRDKGLFKEILKQSFVMQGRYFVAPHYGHELNTANLEQYINDPASGMSDIKQKYPCVVCIAPKSRKATDENGMLREEYYFNLFFLCLSGRTGDQKIKSIDASTNSSTHHTWYDWKDMKEVADNFMAVLKDVINKRAASTGERLKTLVNLNTDGSMTTRLTKFNNDQVSGVGVTFTMALAAGICETIDYDVTAVSTIVIPELDIHPIHKH